MEKLKWILVLGLPLMIGSSNLAGHAQEPSGWIDDDTVELAPYVPTPMEVVERMLALAEVKKGDVLYDLGSGDGRIVITAAKRYGVRGVGFEINSELVEFSRESARSEGVAHLVDFRDQDVLTADFSPATVVTIYLLPESNMLLRPKLWRQLKPGARVVSNEYDMEDWDAEKIEEVTDSKGTVWTLHFWRILGHEAPRDLR